MELMDTSLDKFYKQVHEKGMTIPEDILGKTAVSVSAGHRNCVNVVLVTPQVHTSCLPFSPKAAASVCTEFNESYMI